MVGATSNAIDRIALAYSRRGVSQAAVVLFLLGLIIYGASFACRMLSSFDLLNLLRDVNFDDSFYYFQIARNLADGKFSTFDGGITQTNGYHPLWLWLITPIYWVFDLEEALFAIKALEITLLTGSVVLMALALRNFRLPWILLLAVLPFFFVDRAFFNGVESAAAIFMLALLFFSISIFARWPARCWWVLAAVAFLLPWVRLEFAAISLMATAILCLIQWCRCGARFGRNLPLSPLKPLFGACLGILVYFTYNKLLFDGFVPVSGAIKSQYFSVRHWESEGGYDLARNFYEVLQIPRVLEGLFLSFEIVIYFSLVAWSVYWARRRGHDQRDSWLLLFFLAGVLSLGLGHLAKVVHTGLALFPQGGAANWYHMPVYFMAALIVPIRSYVAVYFIGLLLTPRSPPAANILTLVVLAGFTFFLLASTSFGAPFRSIDRASEATGKSRNTIAYAGTQMMNRILPEDSVVGSWDSGVIGYFSTNPVVNLDGLVNSYAYLRARLEGDEKRFFQKFGITYFANPLIIRDTASDDMIFEGDWFPLRVGDYRFKLWRAAPIVPAASAQQGGQDLWATLEPHFQYQSHGVALFIDGNLVQFIERDCQPEVIPGVFHFSWNAAGPERSGFQYQWTDRRRDPLGFCVDTVELPNNAVHPISIDTEDVEEAIDRIIQATQSMKLVIESEYDVYFSEDRLIYLSHSCDASDARTSFFLHVIPVNKGVLDDVPGGTGQRLRTPSRFARLDFPFDGSGFIAGNTCAVVRSLPGYEISYISTGQHLPGTGTIWNGEVSLISD